MTLILDLSSQDVKNLDDNGRATLVPGDLDNDLDMLVGVEGTLRRQQLRNMTHVYCCETGAVVTLTFSSQRAIAPRVISSGENDDSASGRHGRQLRRIHQR